jgi:hypothetical protein
MAKKGLLVLIIAVLLAGGAFAQSDFASMAKNTVTVDLGPTILGLAVGMLPNFMPDLKDFNPKGFGFAGQYERQLSRPLSVALRGAYLSVGGGMNLDEEDYTMKMDASIESFSVEGHVRFYPFAKAFFLDGMVGYANLKMNGSISVEEKRPGGQKESHKIPVDRSYLKLGAKLGWRISFGKNGGFTFEPALGYSFPIGLGTPIGKQLADKYKEEFDEGDISSITDMFSYVEQFGVGGPRFSLAFGYRF